MKFDIELLKELCQASGVSGYEDEVAEIVAKHLTKTCDSVYKDSLGNIIAFKKGRKTPKEPIMLCAHLDEVGFSVKHINDDGTLDFEQVGMMTSVLPGKKVLVSDRKIPGVVSSKPVHLSNDRTTACKISDLVIDIGALSKDETQKLDLLGEYAVFDSEFVFLSDDTVKAKALDDRIGCAVMIMLSQQELEYDLHFAFTVGEELGGVGAIAATNTIKPGICILFEGTTASDLAGYADKDKVCKKGNGAVCPFMDGGTFYDKGLYNKVLALAKENDIPVQTKTKVAGGTDGSRIQRTNIPVKVVALSLPCRYIHTSSSVASTKDMQSILELAQLLVNSL